MELTETDVLATAVVDRHADFESALGSSKRSYPKAEFDRFVAVTREYVEKTQTDQLVHRNVVKILNGLCEGLRLERKRIPGDVLSTADRLECMFFMGYDPYFDGNEPPGL